MKRVAIYHYQYYRGACKICYRQFINEMLESYEKCHELAQEIYGECEFFHYTDFGQYDSNTLDRPSFHRFEEALDKNEFDVVMCYTLNTITTNETPFFSASATNVFPSKFSPCRAKKTSPAFNVRVSVVTDNAFLFFIRKLQSIAIFHILTFQIN